MFFMLSDLPNDKFAFMADNYVPFDDENVNYHLFYVLNVPWTTIFSEFQQQCCSTSYNDHE